MALCCMESVKKALPGKAELFYDIEGCEVYLKVSVFR